LAAATLLRDFGQSRPVPLSYANQRPTDTVECSEASVQCAVNLVQEGKRDEQFAYQGCKLPEAGSTNPEPGLERRAIGKGAEILYRAQAGVDMDARNSPLDLVLVKRLSKSSIASTVESGLSTLRRTHTRLSSSGGSSSSSLRVPER